MKKFTNFEFNSNPFLEPRFQQNRFAAEQPRGSRGSDHSIIQYLTPEAQQRFRSHVSELQDRKKGKVSVVG